MGGEAILLTLTIHEVVVRVSPRAKRQIRNDASHLELYADCQKDGVHDSVLAPQRDAPSAIYFLALGKSQASSNAFAWFEIFSTLISAPWLSFGPLRSAASVRKRQQRKEEQRGEKRKRRDQI